MDWSGESVKILQDRLKEAGFEVVENNIRSNWNPSEEDLAKIPALVTALIGEKERKENKLIWDKYQCPCGYVYDPEKGDPTQNVAPGTAWKMFQKTGHAQFVIYQRVHSSRSKASKNQFALWTGFHLLS